MAKPTPPFLPDPVDLFHPVIAQWFADRFGEPTDVQGQAWPRIAAGDHLLATAPTGSGKTLTAFLWSLDRLLSGQWREGGVRVLYVSPLKALNTDIERNLRQPLAELNDRFAAAGIEVPAIRAMTRSGDTPQAQRRRMLRSPPEILITTPESLNILLTSQGGRSLLTGLETVILDEIHAVAGSKRGTHLMTAVERLTLLSGEVQRLALSATVRPLEKIAAFVGGFMVEGLDEPDPEPRYRARPVTVVRSRDRKKYDISVRSAPDVEQPLAASRDGREEDGALDPTAPETADEQSTWDRMVPHLRAIIRANTSTLLFASSRQTTERLTRLLNEGEASDFVYSHHGSLSKEVRQVVEQRLKEGELAAIVATSSLELGIDVGEIDHVVLVKAPRSISSAVQRVGRAGHRVGEVSRGTLFPTFGRDFLDGAVIARSIVDGEIEEVEPIEAPLDVLAQVLLSMCVSEEWEVEQLFGFIKTSYPYRELTRRQFDLVIEMLTGRYADARLRELKPRLALDRLTGRVKARPGTARLLYMGGGTIPDRGYYTLRIQGSMARLGELDEEFVWERSVGDSFTLGTQSWRVQQITHNDVLVSPAHGGAMAPFWRADRQERGHFFSNRVACFLEEVEGRIADPKALASELVEGYCMTPEAAEELVLFLQSQRTALQGPLPHRHRLVVERVLGGGAGNRCQVILHTFWGGKVNRPLTIALAEAWRQHFPGDELETFSDDDCVLLSFAETPAMAGWGEGGLGHELLSLVDPSRVESLLRGRLESTGFFGAHFRQNAGRALLLPKAGFRHRTPLWLSRKRSKQLLESVRRYDDFPLTVETWRTCLRDEVDLENLKRLLAEVESGEIALAHVQTHSPSPFASGLVWRQTSQLMYEDDTPEGAGKPSLSQELLRELVFSSALRPKIAPRLIAELEAKLQRLHPGYAPRGASELVEWVKERLFLPPEEWQALQAAVERDQREELSPEEAAWVEERLTSVELPGAVGEVVSAVEMASRISQALAPPQPSPSGDDEADPLVALLGEWLRFHGPMPVERLERLFVTGEAATDSAQRLRSAVEELVGEGRLVVDLLSEDASEPELCDTENLETLLRWRRAAARPSFEALPLAALPLFLAAHQGLARPVQGGEEGGIELLQTRLEQLLALPLPAGQWESEVLPARLDPYYPAWLDTLTSETELLWVGAGKAKIAFCFPEDVDLLPPPATSEADPAESEKPPGDAVAAIFPERSGRYAVMELAGASGLSSTETEDRLWQLAWQGWVTNDSWAALRRSALGGFKRSEVPASQGAASAARRGGFQGGRRRSARWRPSSPYAGRWRVIGTSAQEAGEADPLTAAELAKERARLLIGRYGVVFRQLLARESPTFQWRQVFRALRLMELSGEVLAGHFFAGVPGPQFVSRAAFRSLSQGLPEESIFWLCAADPASLCGVDLEELRGTLPHRHPTTHLVFEGRRLRIVSRRKGRELEISVPPDHPSLPALLGFLKVLVSREVAPLKSVQIEKINGEAAGKSPYLAVLKIALGGTPDPKGVRIWKRYTALVDPRQAEG